MNFSEPFIRRPIATSLLAIALLIAGCVAYTFLSISPLPKVDLPTVQVSANLPGASPETMAAAVATPLERRFGRIAGLTEVTSVSALGSTQLTLQFDLGRDADSAARDVQAAINAAGGELPPNLPFRPSFRKVNPADAPIMIVALSSDTMPLAQLFETGNTIFAQKISQVQGVGQVFVGGGQQPAVRVQIDPMLLAGLGLGFEDVRAAIAASTADQPKGSLTGETQSTTIAANDQLFGAAAFRDVIIANKSGAAVRLGDVAKVVDDVENRRTAGWVDGVRGVILVIRKQPDANIIEVTDNVRALLPTLAQSVSPAIRMEVVIDRTETIRASVRDVEHTLIISVVLVVLVVFVFLRSPRATAIPIVAVPLSLVGTFGAMYLLNYSLDNLSLMALTIATGFVVDDAIVVTENISRFLELGMSPLDAALKGAKQIGFTIVSITCSLLAVFIPILLMGGVIGKLFREFAVTLSVAIAISAVVSLTLTPMMCSRLLRKEHEHGRLYHATERLFTGLVDAYDRALSAVLRHRTLVLLLTLVTLGVTIYLYAIVPKGLFPQQDTGQIAGFTQAPQDISFPAMADRQEAVNAVVRADPDVAHFVSFVGGGPSSTGNTGSVFMQLKPVSQRTSTSDQIIARLRPQLAKVEGITLYLQSGQDVRLGGRPTRTQYQYTLQDADLNELLEWSPRMLDAMRKLPQLRDVNTDQQTAGLQLGLAIDRDMAAQLGVSPQLIDDTLYDAFGQRQIATTYTQVNQYRVVLELRPDLAEHPDALKSMFVKGPNGSPIPLDAVTKTTTTQTSLAVTHQGQFPCATLSFNLAPGASLGQAVDAIHKVETDMGLPASVHGAFAGTAQAYADSLRTQPFLILAALFTVYIVLGMLYESYVHPITILSTLPSAGVGALLALMATKTEFSIIALIGILLLVGIVKKNAIMMIDFAIEAERDEGLTPQQAIHKASVLRFRPIMMTTMAALFGGLPLALGGGAGAELRKPLGITIVGGLLLSQALTLFTTPVIYLALDRFTKKHRRSQELAAETETAPAE
jgi:hydrophobe/amphiphile efflux-1 (HAE1) family protein